MDQHIIEEDKQWKNIYLIGGIATIILVTSTLFDIFAGTSLGGNLSTLPQTAIDRFIQFKNNWLLGLYNLDLLNMINQIIIIPAFFALYAVHKKTNNALSMLALIIFLVGTTIFISNNVALPMLELSHKYFSATTDVQKTLIAAAGEAMLIRGAHGSFGVFVGFMFPNIANILMSFVMLKGKIFGKITSYFGIIGSILISTYIVLVTFVPSIKNIAVAISAPGGILLIIWMILFATKLIKLSRKS